MDVGALLLTGGSSRRMGRDKAALAGPDGVPLAVRTGQLLSSVAVHAVEVGPGRSRLRSVPDERPGEGPLAAVATGATALRRSGWEGAVVVVATDLPMLDAGLLSWLAGHRSEGSVVPLVGGHPQWLCARYDAASIDGAPGLVAQGERRMEALTAGRPLYLGASDEWTTAGAGRLAPFDVDTPADLAAVTAGWDEAGE